MTAKRLAAIALGTMALFIVLVAALHGLKPEYDPSWRFLSEYSIGAHGWVMMLAFFAWAASCVALGMALRAEAVTRGLRIGRAVLLAVGLSLIVAGLFAQDPVTAEPEEMTTHGTMHAFASMVGIPGVPLAALLISRSLERASEWIAAPRIGDLSASDLAQPRRYGRVPGRGCPQGRRVRSRRVGGLDEPTGGAHLLCMAHLGEL